MFCAIDKPFFNQQPKKEILKYKIRNFSVNYTKHLAKDKQQQGTNFETQLKNTRKMSG